MLRSEKICKKIIFASEIQKLRAKEQVIKIQELHNLKTAKMTRTAPYFTLCDTQYSIPFYSLFAVAIKELPIAIV